MIKRKIQILLLVLILLGTSGWWVFHVPYNEEMLYRAIPNDSIFISEHSNLASRWKTFLKNPLPQILLTGFGIFPEATDELTKDAATDKIIKLLGSKKTIVAYVPDFGTTRRPAWVFASWAGYNTHLVRWGLFDPLLKDFDKINLRFGNNAWILKDKKSQAGLKETLSLAVYDGLVLGCYSYDPEGVSVLLKRVGAFPPVTGDYRLSAQNPGLLPPVVSELKQKLENKKNGIPDPASLDIGWIRLNGRNPRRIWYELGLNSEKTASGWVKGIPGFSSVEANISESDTHSINTLLGDTADILAVMPLNYFNSIFHYRNSNPWLKAIDKYFEDNALTNGAFFLAVLKDSCSGRIVGLKVPTILIGIRVNDESSAVSAIPSLIDRINAGSQLGIITVPYTDSNGNNIITIGSTKKGIAGNLSKNEAPAFAIKNGWLLFSSNSENLTKILSGEFRSTTGNCRWFKYTGKKSATGYIFMDFESANKALRNVIAVASLALMAENREESADQREQLAYVRSWIESLKSLKYCMIQLNSSPTQFNVDFSLGQDPPATDMSQ